jgi:hypothetical protein
VRGFQCLQVEQTFPRVPYFVMIAIEVIIPGETLLNKAS